MKKSHFLIALLSLMIIFAALSACAPAAGEANGQPSQNSDGDKKTEADQAAEPMSGSLDLVLLNDKDLYACAKAYSFLKGEGISLEFTAKNNNGNPATIWLLPTSLNGWDLSGEETAPVIVTLSPGEEKTQTLQYPLNPGTTAGYLNIGRLCSLGLTAEGYVDSSNYEYTKEETLLEIPDESGAYRQAYGEAYHALLENEYISVAYCGKADDTGKMVFCLEINSPLPEGGCKLYPVTDGVFDTDRYVALDELDLSQPAKKLISFLPVEDAGAAAPQQFYLVEKNNAFAPALLTIPGGTNTDPGFKSLVTAASSQQIALHYSSAERRFYAENLTEDQVLVLTAEASFELDGNLVKANPQSILCFPQTATAFRLSGRGKDDKNVERNITIREESQTISAGWTVRLYEGGQEEGTLLGTLSMDAYPLH